MDRHPGWTDRFRVAISLAAMLVVAGTLCSCLKEYPPVEEYIGPALQAADARCAPGPLPMATTQPVGATQPEPLRRVEPPPTGPLRLSVQNAVLLALEHNLALNVDRINPQIKQTFETEALAVFDPLLSGQISYGRSADRKPGNTPAKNEANNAIDANIGVSVATPTGGSVSASLDTTNSLPDAGRDSAVTAASLAITQSLLKGAGLEVNLASIRQARLDTLSSQYELRGFAEQLVSDVQTTYWNYTLAQRQIEIVTASLKIAQEQLEQTDQRIRVGNLAETDRAAAEAEVALREEALIDARSTLVQTRLKLLQLINPGGGTKGRWGEMAIGREGEGATGQEGEPRPTSPSPVRPIDFWDRPIEIVNWPAAPAVAMDDVELHVRVALKMRSDLNQARLQVKRGDLQVVKTKNGLLPQLDLFVNLGKTGYADSFGTSVGHMFTRHSYEAMVGLNYSQSPLNRGAIAADRQAVLLRDQAAEAVANLAQTVQVDVRSAYEELKRTTEQVRATAVTRRLQEQTLARERELFKVGKSPPLLVAQAERDLLAAQINEVQAVVNNLNAFVTLFRLEGSLLERMGIQAPGCAGPDRDASQLGPVGY